MAIIETNVAGTTHYNIEFSKINTKSTVILEMEPGNPYDQYAIKVIISGKQVGYIRRSENRPLVAHLKEGNEIKARIKAIVGGAGGKNYGIVLSLNIVDGYEKRKYEQDLGKTIKTPLEEFVVYKSERSISDIQWQPPTYEEFLEESRGLIKAMALPVEPNYKALFKMERSFFSRLVFGMNNEYIENKKKMWIAALEAAKTNNELRIRQMQMFNRINEEESYQKYIKKSKALCIMKRNQISTQSNEQILESQQNGYISTYENLLFTGLKDYYEIYRQAEFEGHCIDMVLIDLSRLAVWGLEVDGGIHKRKKVSERDRYINKYLPAKGISLIRVSNSFLKRGIANAIVSIRNVIENS